MPYINADYYENTFKGTMPANAGDLSKAILRANDVIDMVIGYKLEGKDIEAADFNTFIRNQVKKATAAQTQFFVTEDADSKFAGDSDANSVGIGAFSYSVKESSNKVKSMVNPATMQYLSPTGLLHAGVDIVEY